MRRPDQERIFKSLPGLENAEFVRFGSVHRNSFINSPCCLTPELQLRSQPGLFFAGQITGVEGYVESTAAGLVAGIGAAHLVQGKALPQFTDETAIGALVSYVSDPERKDFQPMNISFGLMPGYLNSPKRRISKKDRRIKAANFALEQAGKLASEVPFLTEIPQEIALESR
jgi:methylenetetrahydrofolate--tRNA-(uracil-5-)-methyltransferase